MVVYGMFEYIQGTGGDGTYTRSAIYRVEYRCGCIYASLNIRGVDVEIVQGGSRMK